MKTSKTLRMTAIALAVAGPLTSAMATNGMNLEGYGPISHAMGGAAQSFDHGTAGMIENPATLALMAPGTRLDAAVGFLEPKIKTSMPMPGGPSVDSGGKSYMMPAVGWTRRSGGLTFGVGLFSQGGMGTEYDANSFLAMGSGSSVRSELGVGKVIIPVAYQVNPNLAVGATLDFMWAGMDMKMAASGAQLAEMAGKSGVMPTGNLAGALPMLAGAPWARIEFSDGDKFTGAAKGSGYTAKIGATYKISNTVGVGGSYHFKSQLGDMKTAAGSASFSAPGGMVDTGTLTVLNFQWPSITAIGANVQATPSLMLAADYKVIGWADVMKNFQMRYDSGVMGGSVNFAMDQNWKDQYVLSLGAAWKASNQLTVRAGVNLADNPVPDATVNPLFPATIKSHYSLGLGYEFSPNSQLNVSVAVAPKTTANSGAGPVITHEQQNMQLMYTYRY